MSARDAAKPMPRISVVIPCFNVAPYVAPTLESVLAQDHPAFEVIAVDDGSTDATPAILQQFESRGVRLIRQPNRGAAVARNAGFAQSTGAAILYLDGDDLIAPGHLRALETALGGNAAAIAFGQWDRFRSDPAEAVFPARPGYRDADPVDWLVADWAHARPMTQCGTFLIPRSLVARHGGWDESLSLIDDFEFFARLITGSDRLCFAPAARVYYRSGVPASLSSRKTRRAAQSALSALLLGTGHLLRAERAERTRQVCAAVLADFEYRFYPDFPDLRRIARRRAAELGRSDLQPDGPPGFQRLRRYLGWRAARRVQILMERLRKARSMQSQRTHVCQ